MIGGEVGRRRIQHKRKLFFLRRKGAKWDAIGGTIRGHGDSSGISGTSFFHSIFFLLFFPPIKAHVCVCLCVFGQMWKTDILFAAAWHRVSAQLDNTTRLSCDSRGLLVVVVLGKSRSTLRATQFPNGFLWCFLNRQTAARLCRFRQGLLFYVWSCAFMWWKFRSTFPPLGLVLDSFVLFSGTSKLLCVYLHAKGKKTGWDKKIVSAQRSGQIWDI